MSKDKDTFSVGDDLLDAFQDGEDDAVWAMLEWAKGFYDRTGRPATLRDLMTEKPKLEYQGLYE